MRRIWLCGQSMWSDGLAVYLHGLRGPQVFRAPDPAVLDPAQIGDHGIVVFDGKPPADVLALMRARPGLVVMSVDTAAGVVTIMSGHTHRVRTLADVTRMIEAFLASPEDAAPACPVTATAASAETRQPAKGLGDAKLAAGHKEPGK